MTKYNKLSILWFFLGFGIFVFTRLSKLVPTIPIAILCNSDCICFHIKIQQDPAC